MNKDCLLAEVAKKSLNIQLIMDNFLNVTNLQQNSFTEKDKTSLLKEIHLNRKFTD